MKINIDLMFIGKAKFKAIIDKIAYFYNIFMCFLKIEAFACVDFQRMDKTDKRIFKIS